jgi:hypothetical protein
MTEAQGQMYETSIFKVNSLFQIKQCDRSWLRISVGPQTSNAMLTNFVRDKKFFSVTIRTNEISLLETHAPTTVHSQIKYNPVKYLSLQKKKKKKKNSFLYPSFSDTYEGVSKSFRTGCLERELQMVQLSATRCSCITILWVSLVSFAAITFCVASGRVFIAVSAYFVVAQSGNFWIQPCIMHGYFSTGGPKTARKF